MKKRYYGLFLVGILTITIFLIPILVKEDECMKIRAYYDLGIVNTKKPQNTHMWIEEDGNIYLVDSTDNTSIYKSTDKGDNWVQIDLDPGDIHGGANDKERPQNIQALWHDKTNGRLYLIDCDNTNPANTITASYITFSTDLTTELGNITAGGGHTYRAFDVFQIGVNTYILIHEAWAENWFRIYDIDAGFNLIDSEASSLGAWSGLLPVVVVSDTEAYFIFHTGVNNAIVSYFEVGGGDPISLLLSIGTSNIPDANQRAIAYDGSDILYFILTDTGDNKEYLYTYSISLNTDTKHGEHNISLMLDRNTAPGVLEKAFHLTEPKVYEIQTTVQQLNLIAEPYIPGYKIIAITDNFLMTDTI